MADILNSDEIDALLSTVGADYSPYDIYIHKKSNKEYYLLQTIFNKTDGTIMIIYRATDNFRLYARSKKDFFNKFVKKGANHGRKKHRL